MSGRFGGGLGGLSEPLGAVVELPERTGWLRARKSSFEIGLEVGLQ